MLDHSQSKYQPKTTNSNPTPSVYGQETPTSSNESVEPSINPTDSQQLLNQAVGELLSPITVDPSVANHPPAKVPENVPSSPPVSANIKSTPISPPQTVAPASALPNIPPKTISSEPTSQPVAASIVSIPQKIAEEIRENPLIQTEALGNDASAISWKKTVIISVLLFFVGALLALIVMFLLY